MACSGILLGHLSVDHLNHIWDPGLDYPLVRIVGAEVGTTVQEREAHCAEIFQPLYVPT